MSQRKCVNDSEGGQISEGDVRNNRTRPKPGLLFCNAHDDVFQEDRKSDTVRVSLIIILHSLFCQLLMEA
uniref:Uncharacterized protein n=1 Tax=Romanomermis culicivorax TaxID=13658 RepID=A0A915L0F9_ROMCU